MTIEFASRVRLVCDRDRDRGRLGLEEAAVASQTGAGDVAVRGRNDSVKNKRTFWPYNSAAGNMTRSVSRICQIQYAKLHSIDRT